MAITRVQGKQTANNATGAATVSVTLNAAVGSGNCVCGLLSWETPGPTLNSVTDDKGNTYNLETAIADAGFGQQSQAFSLTNITNGPITISGNFSATAPFSEIIADEFSGTSTASSDERDGAAHGGQVQDPSPGNGTDAVTSGTFTTSTNGDLIYGVATNTGNANHQAAHGTNFTDAVNSNTSGALSQSEYRVQATAGAGTAATFTQSLGEPWITFLIAIKPAAGGGATLNTAWFRPGETPAPRKFQADTCPAIALTPGTLPPKVSGMAWFEPPDRGRPATKITVESPPAIALTPATLPPKIAGMAWFEPWDSYQPRQLGKSEPPAFGRAIAQPSTIAGMAWFEPWDVLQQPRRGKDEPHPLVRAPVSIVVPPQSASDVFPTRRPAKDEPHPFVKAPASIVIPPPLIPDALQRRSQGRDEPHPFVAPPQPTPQPTLWPPQLVQDIFWSRRPLASDLAFVIPPPNAGTPISGMAWFEPWDRDRPALKVSVEASVALVLTPDTLPPVISGMAWFEPWDTRQLPPPRVHMADVFPSGVFSTKGTVTPTEPPPDTQPPLLGAIDGTDWSLLRRRRRREKTSREELDELLADIIAEAEGPKPELTAKRAARRVIKRAKHDGRLDEIRRHAEQAEHKRLDQAELVDALVSMAQRHRDDEMAAVLLLLSH